MTGDVTQLLRACGATLSVAESCTGGRLAAAFTAGAGASAYFRGGVVAYDNEVKIGVLGVSRETLERHGAVSRQVAEQMALGVRRLMGADFAVATTGIAGPGGGTPGKPVGTVWIAVAAPKRDDDPVRDANLPRNADSPDADSLYDATSPCDDDPTHDPTPTNTADRVISRCFHFTGSRAENMDAAVRAAIVMLHAALTE